MSLVAMEPAFNELSGTQLLHTFALQARPHICERMLTITRLHRVLLSTLPPHPLTRISTLFLQLPLLQWEGQMAKPNLHPFLPFILHRSCLVNEKVPRAEVATSAFQVMDQ